MPKIDKEYTILLPLTEYFATTDEYFVLRFFFNIDLVKANLPSDKADFFVNALFSLILYHLVNVLSQNQ